MARGAFTQEIKEKYGITMKQLRLLPYFQYLLMNESKLDARKIDDEERTILQQWRDEGKITFSISEPCTCTKEFWDWMNEILWESYVPHKAEEYPWELDKLDPLPEPYDSYIREQLGVPKDHSDED